jgi:hypothetical protein
MALTSKLRLVQEYRDHFHVIPKQSDIMMLSETELLAKMHRRWQRDQERRMAIKIQTRYRGYRCKKVFLLLVSS